MRNDTTVWACGVSAVGLYRNTALFTLAQHVFFMLGLCAGVWWRRRRKKISFLVFKIIMVHDCHQHTHSITHLLNHSITLLLTHHYIVVLHTVSDSGKRTE